MCSYYRRFVQNFACIAQPLYDTLKNTTGKTLNITDNACTSFDKLKELICSDDVMTMPDFGKLFEVDTDASSFAIGACLPFFFISRNLTKSEKNYHVTEKECLAVIFALKKFRHYLLHRKFLLF